MIINLGTLVVTALLLRIAIVLAVPNTTERGLHLITRATQLVIWPLHRLPPLQHPVVRGLTVADVAALIIVVCAWIITLGVVAGWEHEGQRQTVGSSETGLRP